MPKTLIVFAGDDPAGAEAIAEGARSVRFAEVDVLPIDPPPDPTSYDAVVVDAALPDVGLLGGAPLADKVASAFGVDDAARWGTLRSLADRGCLIVPPAEDAHAHGRRVATVAGWIHHARSHRHH
ncbi:hypothetical protein [Gemmatirosa kalamazoonensis]|nr:hypothetical protein [Gemmatirosa kalamazoonensis]